MSLQRVSNILQEAQFEHGALGLGGTDEQLASLGAGF